MCGACLGTLVTWPWLRLSMIYSCDLRYWSQIWASCGSCCFPVSVALSCCAWQDASGPRAGCIRVVTEHFDNPNLSGVVAKCCFFGLWCKTEPLCVQSLPYPDQDDRIFDWLLASMAAVQAVDDRASFLFVDDLNGRHQSGVVGFYEHEPSWSCSLWLLNCLRFRLVGCRPNSCTWWNTWPPDD